jgi:hypothetical protein
MQAVAGHEKLKPEHRKECVQGLDLLSNIKARLFTWGDSCRLKHPASKDWKEVI